MILSVQQQNIKYPVDVQNVIMLGCIHPRYPTKSHQLYADIIPDLAIYKNMNNVIKKYCFAITMEIMIMPIAINF